MKSISRFLSLFLTAALLVGAVPAARAVEVRGVLTIDRANKTITIQTPDRTDRDCLREAVALAEDGYTITVETEGRVNVASYDGTRTVNDPWLIDKAVTIQGGCLEFLCCGILLGADVTFKNTQISMLSPVRNCIMANGHTLTLENVTVDSYAAQQVHLFCGAPTLGGFTSVFTPKVPQPGELGQIVIKGTTSMGNIYAGGIYTGDTSGSGLGPEASRVPARIVIDPSSTGKMGAIYACGALEQPAPDNWFDLVLTDLKVDPPAPSTSGCPTLASVGVALFKNTVAAVHGETGSGADARVTFTGSDDLTSNLSLENLASLQVLKGRVQPSALTGTGLALGVDAGGLLDLSALAGEVQAGDFAGGGELLLRCDQTLALTGSVSGSTQVYSGSRGLNSSSAITPGHTYVRAPGANAPEGAFTLVPTSSGTESFLFDPQAGTWTAQRPDDLPLLSDFAPPESWVVQSGQSLEIPLKPQYPADYSPMDFIPLTLSVNGQAAQMREDENGYLSYSLTLEGQDLLFEVIDDNLCLSSAADPYVPPALPAGTYQIEITLPGVYTDTGLPITRTVVLFFPSDPDQPRGLDLLSPAQGQTPRLAVLTDAPARVLCAVYDGHNALLDILYLEVPALEGVQLLDLTLPEGAERLNCFLLAQEGLAPLCLPARS